MEINYKVLNVSNHITINRKFQVPYFFENRRQAALYKMFEIDNNEMSDIGKYVFFIELHLYYDDNMIKGISVLSPAKESKGDELNVFLGDVNRTDYDAHKVQKNHNLNYEYHLLVDTNVDHYKKGMDFVRSSPFYIGEYIYKDISTEKIVVIIKSMCRQHIDKCIAGKFSEIFSENNYECLTSRLGIVTTYFDIDFKNKNYYFTDISAILCGVKKVDDYFNEADRIIEEFKIDCQKTIDILYERHGYSKIEILN